MEAAEQEFYHGTRVPACIFPIVPVTTTRTVVSRASNTTNTTMVFACSGDGEAGRPRVYADDAQSWFNILTVVYACVVALPFAIISYRLYA